MAKFLSFLVWNLSLAVLLIGKNNNNVVVAFQPVPRTTRTYFGGIVTTARMSLANENAIVKIQEEYRQIREKLRQGLLSLSSSLPEGGNNNNHGQVDGDNNMMIDPIVFTQELLEKAADLAALQRYQQEEIILEAQKELRHAQQDHVLADAIQHQAHEEYKIVQEQLDQLESFEDIDSGYEDRERLRDMSVAHAAGHLEHDARELSIESQFHELEAADKEDRAVEFLHYLELIEQELQDTLKAVRKYQNERAMKEWAIMAAPKHEQFLGVLNTKFNTGRSGGTLDGEISF